LEALYVEALGGLILGGPWTPYNCRLFEASFRKTHKQPVRQAASLAM